MPQAHNEIIGMEELEKALREFGPMMQGKMGFPKNPLRNASRAMAKQVEASAKSKAPRDTGRLQNSITYKLLSVKYRDQQTMRGDSSELFYVGAKKGKTRNDPNGAWYAKFVELGTDRHAAQPFLRPALEENRVSVVSTFEEKFGKDVNKIASTLYRKYGYAQAKGRLK